MMDLSRALSIREQRSRRPAEILTGVVREIHGADAVGVDMRSGELVRARQMRGYTPSRGDVCLVFRAGGLMYAVGAINGAAPADIDARPPLEENAPPPPSALTRNQLPPIFSGTYREGQWMSTPNLYQGARTTDHTTSVGAAYYGHGPGALDGPPEGARVHLRRLNTVGLPAPRRPIMALLAGHTPAEAPTPITTATGPHLSYDQRTAWPLPLGWARALIDGEAGGIGVVGGEWIALAGPAEWSPALSLEIERGINDAYRT